MTDKRVCGVVTATKFVEVSRQFHQFADASVMEGEFHRVPTGWCLHPESEHAELDGVWFCKACRMHQHEFGHPVVPCPVHTVEMSVEFSGVQITRDDQCPRCHGIGYVTASCCECPRKHHDSGVDDNPNIEAACYGRQYGYSEAGCPDPMHGYDPGGRPLDEVRA